MSSHSKTGICRLLRRPSGDETAVPRILAADARMRFELNSTRIPCEAGEPLTFRGNVHASSSLRMLARSGSNVGSRGTVGTGSPVRTVTRLLIWFCSRAEKVDVKTVGR